MTSSYLVGYSTGRRLFAAILRKGLADRGYVIDESATMELRCRISLG